ncbi:MAG: tRNA-dihydrouridine synthase [Planctomycetaceae bacterium]|nr:tRNA-dihydrouridine synthase [Planctomycetaceae bacterium]
MRSPQTDTQVESAEIEIGLRTIPSRYFLSPLAGYTHLAFRMAIRELGGLGLATTDLVLASMLVSEKPKSMALIATDPDDRPLSVQIFSGLRDELVQAARWLEEHGYQAVDINMGCPMAKVNGNGGGARLMCDTENAQATVAAVVEAVSIPVTVKMRLGWDSNQITAPELACAFEQVGAAAITLHGRTRQQGFHGTVDLEGIRQTVEAVDHIPIIGNGDVRTVEDAQQMQAVTGCDAVAIGRGAMLDPWIFRKLAQVNLGESPTEPTAEEQIDFLVRHFTLMTRQHAEYSCLLFRKFAGWYGARLGIPEDLEDRLRRFDSFSEFDAIVQEIHHRHGERETSIPTALLKVPNGPIDKW